MTDDSGWTPLHYAIKMGDNETGHIILERNSSAAYISAGKGDEWSTIFHIAAKHESSSTKNFKVIQKYFGLSSDMIVFAAIAAVGAFTFGMFATLARSEYLGYGWAVGRKSGNAVIHAAVLDSPGTVVCVLPLRTCSFHVHQTY
nr:ankyrin repeat-containing protein ITN1-like [Ipomoea trifida]